MGIEQRIIVFIDESGLSERPCRARTWAPKGQTPVLQYSFSWKQLSVIAGVSYLAFLLSLLPRFDQEPSDRSVPQSVANHDRQEAADRLGPPAGASLAAGQRIPRRPERTHRLGVSAGLRAGINPVEYIWGYLKHHAMPNYCARDLTDLRHRASRNLRSMQRRGTLVTAFWNRRNCFEIVIYL